MTDLAVGDISGRARAFRVARRHTALVRILRFALPTGLAVVIFVFVASVILESVPEFSDFSFDNLKISDGALVMEGPRLSGMDRNARDYTLAANQASQTIGQTDIVNLDGIDAVMSVDRDTSVRIVSAKGTFNQATESLYLFGGVNVSTNTGYQVKLVDATVDLTAGTVNSDEPVAIDMLNGTLEATGVTIVDRGEVVTFKGRINMVLQIHGSEDE